MDRSLLSDTEDDATKMHRLAYLKHCMNSNYCAQGHACLSAFFFAVQNEGAADMDPSRLSDTEKMMLL